MAYVTHIGWADSTWNVVTGCSVISPGCTNCYAMKLAGTRLRHHPSRAGLTADSKAGPVWNGETRTNWEWMDQPLSWTKPRKIFVAAHGDLFHDGVPWEDVAVIVGTAIAAHHLRGHIFQILTKRPARMLELWRREDFWELANSTAWQLVAERVDPLERRSDDARATLDDYDLGTPCRGLWLGFSSENQEWFDKRWLDMVTIAAAGWVTWCSAEPLLGPIDLDAAALALSWLVVGGESGPNARPSHPDWFRSLRDQCLAAQVPFLFKQWGAFAVIGGGMGLASHEPLRQFEDRRWAATSTTDPRRFDLMARIGKKRAGRLLDGVQHDGYPVAR
jgi:protein gp37